MSRRANRFLANAVAAGLLASWAVSAWADSHQQTFEFTDWLVGCDNTRHCEAIGYATEADQSNPVALHLARDAGPGTPLVARLSVQPEGTDGAALILSVEGAAPLRVKDGEAIAPASFARLLPQLLASPSAAVNAGKQSAVLSLSGLKAALLKMDDLQGRIGTPGALVRKGTRAETSVLPPLAAPKVTSSTAMTNLPGDAALLKILVGKIETDCDGETHAAAAVDNTTLQRVSATRVVLVHDCQTGYNSPADVFIANDKPPYGIQPATFAQAPGSPAGDTTNARFDGRVLTTSFKGRGVDDCGSRAHWLWSGKDFVMAEATEASLCRGMFAGYFNVRTWTTTR